MMIQSILEHYQITTETLDNHSAQPETFSKDLSPIYELPVELHPFMEQIFSF